MQNAKSPMILTVALCFLLVPAAFPGGVPQLMNIQGILTNSGGDPVSDGAHTVVFSVYSVESGGSPLWTESRVVVTTGGTFSVVLGEIVPIPGSLFGSANLWLGMMIGGEPEMTPRQQLTAVPYVYRALNADSANFAFTMADDAVTSGKIVDGSIMLVDLAQNGATGGQVIKWNGSAWVAANDETGSGGGWVDDGVVVRLATDADNVGIGTSDPQEKLHVNGDIRLGAASDIAFGSDSTRIYATGGDLVQTADDDLHLQPDDDIYIRRDGGSAWVHFDNSTERLGVGVLNPVEKLHVEGDIRLGSFSDIAFGSDNSRLYSDNVDMLLTADNNLYLRPDNDIYVGRDGASSWIRFDNVGERLGLGTFNPAYRLTVNGTISIASGDASKYHINYYQGGLNIAETGVSDRRIHISDGGNVGIGTATPGAKLGVNGDLKVYGAFRGDISSATSSDGGPFPRPAYDTGWQEIGQDQILTFTHNIGGDRDDYVVELLLWNSHIGVHSNDNYFVDLGNKNNGAYYRTLTSTTVMVYRFPEDEHVERIRLRIWVVE